MQGRPFAFINAVKVFVDLSDTSAPKFLNTECCPVCDKDAQHHCTYDAKRDRLVCECGEIFHMREG